MDKTNDFFGEVISSYTSNEAVEDGYLVENPRTDRFSECNLITRNLFDKIEQMATKRSMKRVFEISAYELIGCLMIGAAEIYTNKQFKGDNDKDFFVMPKTEEGMVVWFVRNETGKLTAMLPEDY